jgi:hypothetical protein
MAEKDEVDPRAWEAAVARIDEWDREIDVVAETKDWARRSDDATGTYVGGELAGHAYLYSFRESKILCAGIFRATNMGEIEVSVKRRRDGVVLEDTFRRSADSQLTSFAQTEALTNLQLAGAPP